jgi:PadR family transcriptional regulator, regulatory protein PadR
MAPENSNLENSKMQMRKGLLEYCILLTIARQEEAYTSDILQELKADNLLVVEGTLYPLLSRLKSEHLLDYSWKESQAGPPRKYYRLTAQGKKALEDLNETWRELSKSINSLQRKYHEENN